jgi:hypothetical protein
MEKFKPHPTFLLRERCSHVLIFPYLARKFPQRSSGYSETTRHGQKFVGGARSEIAQIFWYDLAIALLFPNLVIITPNIKQRTQKIATLISSVTAGC